MTIKFSNIVNVETELRKAMSGTRDHDNTGYLQFEIKKDLYRIKWLMEDYFSNAPKFVGEDEWVDKMMQKRVIEILKK